LPSETALAVELTATVETVDEGVPFTKEVAGEAAEIVAIAFVGAVAFAATVERPPNAAATAATSATRLNVVFVDICFLSRKQSKVRISLSRLG
jgi:hypothetical protein